MNFYVKLALRWQFPTWHFSQLLLSDINPVCSTVCSTTWESKYDYLDGPLNTFKITLAFFLTHLWMNLIGILRTSSSFCPQLAVTCHLSATNLISYCISKPFIKLHKSQTFLLTAPLVMTVADFSELISYFKYLFCRVFQWFYVYFILDDIPKPLIWWAFSFLHFVAFSCHFVFQICCIPE